MTGRTALIMPPLRMITFYNVLQLCNGQCKPAWTVQGRLTSQPPPHCPSVGAARVCSDHGVQQGRAVCEGWGADQSTIVGALPVGRLYAFREVSFREGVLQ